MIASRAARGSIRGRPVRAGGSSSARIGATIPQRESGVYQMVGRRRRRRRGTGSPHEQGSGPPRHRRTGTVMLSSSDRRRRHERVTTVFRDSLLQSEHYRARRIRLQQLQHRRWTELRHRPASRRHRACRHCSICFIRPQSRHQPRLGCGATSFSRVQQRSTRRSRPSGHIIVRRRQRRLCRCYGVCINDIPDEYIASIGQQRDGRNQQRGATRTGGHWRPSLCRCRTV